MAVTITQKNFVQDNQGKKYRDVFENKRLSKITLKFFSTPHRQQRMIDAELYHDRPALSGVIKEFECHPDVKQFLSEQDINETRRFKQFVGVVVRLVMEKMGWKKTGRKVSLGAKVKSKSKKTVSGIDYNHSGISLWFTKTEQYEPKESNPLRAVWENIQQHKPGVYTRP